MARSRADEILEGWKIVVHSASKPVDAPRPHMYRSALPLGLVGTAAVVLVLLIGLSARGIGLGPKSSSTSAGTPTASTSPSAPQVQASAGARPLSVAGGGSIACNSEGGCAAFFSIQPLGSATLPGWQFGVTSEGGLTVPADAPRSIIPGRYTISARLTWVTDVFVNGQPQGGGGVVAVCSSDVTIDASAAAVAIQITFHGLQPCEIGIQSGLASQSPSPPPTMTAQTASPAEVAAARQAVDSYTAALVRGDYATGWAMLAPEAQSGWASFQDFIYERSAYFKSVAGRYTVQTWPSGVLPITDWLPATKGASIDLRHAVLVEVNYPALAMNNAGYSIYVVSAGPNGLLIYDVR